VIALPVVPVDTVAEALVFPLQILAIEVGVVTGRVPPGALEPGGAVLAPGVVVAVHSRELCPLLRQTLPELSVNAPVDDPELVELCADDEVVDGHLSLVPVPVLQLYQQLLRFRECDVIPVQKSNPVVLLGISEAILVIVPLLEEEVLGFSKVPSSLQHSPAAAQRVHVAPDRDLLARHGDSGHPALGYQVPLHQVRTRGRRIRLWLGSRYRRQNNPPGIII